jgi:hypothetical protein
MIYKKAGCCIKMEKLQVIHLFEADFNLVIGIILGCQTMYKAAEKLLIHSGQYCKPLGEYPDVIFTKILHNHMAWLTKTPLGQFECDATARFDPVIMLFALLCFISCRALTSVCRMWELALSNIDHSIHTSFCESPGSFISTINSPIVGPGQGSKGGPPTP